MENASSVEITGIIMAALGVVILLSNLMDGHFNLHAVEQRNGTRGEHYTAMKNIRQDCFRLLMAVGFLVASTVGSFIPPVIGPAVSMQEQWLRYAQVGSLIVSLGTISIASLVDKWDRHKLMRLIREG